MASVVFVHGIAQEQSSADSLASLVAPALAGGVRTAGYPRLADALSDVRSSARSVQVAFYGDLFQEPPPLGLTDPGDELIEALALSWLANAANFADDGRDRQAASRALSNLDSGLDGTQGVRALLRPAVNSLARLRWFAPLGLSLAQTFATRALSQVALYLKDERVREEAQQRVRNQIGFDTRVVVGHSLGTVVAYEALHTVPGKFSFVTLGSPLGLRNAIYDQLRPFPPSVPDSVVEWVNLFDRDDLVAAHLDLSSMFRPNGRTNVGVTTFPPLNNGAQPHSAVNYLTKAVTGSTIARAIARTPTSDD